MILRFLSVWVDVDVGVDVEVIIPLVPFALTIRDWKNKALSRAALFPTISTNVPSHTVQMGVDLLMIAPPAEYASFSLIKVGVSVVLLQRVSSVASSIHIPAPASAVLKDIEPPLIVRAFLLIDKIPPPQPLTASLSSMRVRI